MAKHRAGGGRHADRSRRRLRRLGRTASRATVVSSLLLPMPVAAAAGPLASTLSEDVLGVTRVPVTGVGDPAHAHRLGRHPEASQRGVEPAASMTRLARSSRDSAVAASKVAANGIPAAALRAYRTAEATMSVADPACGVSWQLLAGIGRIESDHGRYAGAVLGADGVSSPQILGLPLNGVGPVAAITDTDRGALDGDTRWDRAVGPMQFIPSTWAMVGVDGDADGDRNPHDIDDAALAAAAYLCVGGHDLSTPAGAQAAVYSYNHSHHYVALVLGVAHAYATGAVDLPLLTATLQLPTGTGTTVDLPQGRGTPIGATDDVSPKGTPGGKTQDKPAGTNNRADRAQDRGQEDGHGPAGPADHGRGPGSSDGDGERGKNRGRPNNHDDPSEDLDDTTGDLTKRTGSRNDDTDGSDNGNGTGKGGDKVEQPHDTKPSKEEPEAEESEPEQQTVGGVLVYCNEEEATLCLQGNEDEPLHGSTVDVYGHLAGNAVTVTYQSDDEGETWYVLDIVATG